ncbi:importin PSE1 SKDI_13G4390 [Saccharomyces kudriavzevii IFO 1802]|uniref:IPO4/5-like TPR repeats domain-containing protein n=1 Tax=Saccharomyces kudriavzevii (strain ATCC MYA-4449 / AS 2.2408 / CBS 8840 / NBRC 1802 / NCYC 2889) TaxID=226230 RepID=A0AA35J7F2_SACK1|nr:uncharacterized protein SKDI_13G4390 [Saccharomyces kudriavzevii IFO 1802]CAI4048993.1 hypothetical protein SKDI_13G4390 [Saccharomyces kudriavzevii IFO 1802]
MSALPEEVNSTLLQIVQAFASPDNQIRSVAEKALSEEWITENNIEYLLTFLAEQAAFSQDTTVAALSAVLFRKLALKAPPSSKLMIMSKNITHIRKEVLVQIRSSLLKGFLSERADSIRHKLSDAIAECVQDDLPSWPELLQALIESLKSGNPNFRESSFRILTTVPYLITAVDTNSILPIFQSGFTDASDNVKISAVTAFVGYFKQLPKCEWSKLGVLLPSLLNSLPRFLDDGKDDALASVFESLIELVELAPKLFKDMFDQIIQFTDIVIKNKDLEPPARTTALELLTVFSENAPQMCKLNQNYGQTLVMDTLIMMTEVSIDDDDAAEWIESDDTDDEEEVTYDHARQALDRVALKLGGEYLAAPLFQYLQQMITSTEWRERFAAMMALSSAAEGCADVLIGEIPKILDIVIPLINDSHPRVQYGCCNVLGQISTDFSPFIQRTAHDKILPALISKLTSECTSRVQTHAAAALVNFSEFASKDILEPYLDSLLTNLLVLLQSNKLYVQEQALTTIAFIAEAAKNKFIKYYDTLMPLLLNVLKVDNKDNSVLKGKCMECATLIGFAVGKEKFHEHSQELISILVALQNSDIDEDDALRSYLEQSWSRICRILGEDFVPLLPIVIPPLLITAKATQDVGLIEEEEAANFQQYPDWDVVQVQGKHIAIHTSVLDDKVSAMELLQSYATLLRGQFAVYVKEVMEEIALPSLDFYLHDGVRAAGATLIPILLSCLLAATGTQNEELVLLWHKASSKIIGGLMSEPMPEITQVYHNSLVNGIKVMGENCLSEDQLAGFTKGVSANLTDTYERMQDRHGDGDEYNENIDEEEDFTDEDLLDEINKSIAAVLKTTSGHYLKHLENIWSMINTFLLDNEPILVIFALVVIGDLIQYGGEQTASMKSAFIPRVTECLVSSDARIRQAASYIIGVCAQYAPSTYVDVCIPTLDTLVQIVDFPGSKLEENRSSTENASAAIAKILYAYNSNIPNVDTYTANWFKTLPTIADKEAASFNYQFLGHLIENNSPIVCTQSNIATVVDSVIQALNERSLTERESQTVISSVKKLLGFLPSNDALAIFNRYPADIMEKVHKWFA